MRIKAMTATFGKLDKARLELGDGLNLIQAPNEGGKSTWAAFWRAMLYGIDTRDRDKKGYLADKNRYQPWSGAPMEGEMTLEWQGRDITIRRGPKGSSPFAAFSAVYSGTQEAVSGLTADNCGQMLTGAGREVFERSAFIGSGGNLTVTAAPELERRIASLVSSGEEDVSFSQTAGVLREWGNRRRVNRSVGLVPKLEGELQQVKASQSALEEVTARIARLEEERSALEREKGELAAEREVHRRLAQRELNCRYAQAGEELEAARAQLAVLEGESARFGDLPDRALLKKAQGELQYLKVLDEEIKQGESALKEAEEDYVQAQIAVQDEHFAGSSPDEAARRVEADLRKQEQAAQRSKTLKTRSNVLQLLTPVIILLVTGSQLILRHTLWRGLEAPFAFKVAGLALLALSGVFIIADFWCIARRKKLDKEARDILAWYGCDSPEAAAALVQDYQRRCQMADEAARQAKAVRGTLNDRKARRDNSRTDLLRFVHSFAPQVSDLFGCSAALSRALGLDHELAMARDRVSERTRRREDLQAQGGRDFDTLELLQPPDRTPEETERALAGISARLEEVSGALNQARGQQKAMGDPAALAARREELEGALDRRTRELEALSLAMEALQEANTQLQERFSPELNRLAGQYMARLTGERYASVTLNRELEGLAARTGDVLPHSALYLSRGTADQLYLAVRLAVCRLCLPEKPPILLDDALAAFDDQRLALALDLLRELAAGQQVLLFTCQSREERALGGTANLIRLD